MLTRDSVSRLLSRVISPGVARSGERTPHDVLDRARVGARVLTPVEPQRFRADPWTAYEAPGP